jgi:hypothetical protein
MFRVKLSVGNMDGVFAEGICDGSKSGMRIADWGRVGQGFVLPLVAAAPMLQIRKKPRKVAPQYCGGGAAIALTSVFTAQKTLEN